MSSSLSANPESSCQAKFRALSCGARTFQRLVLGAVLVAATACNSNLDPNENPDEGSLGIEPVLGGVLSGPESLARVGFALTPEADTLNVTEGEVGTQLTFNVERRDDYTGTIELAADPATEAQATGISWQFSDVSISPDEDTFTLRVSLDYTVAPILPQRRVLRVIGVDRNNAVVESQLALLISPTLRPDVYLLIGQSNMVGNSEFDIRDSGPGGLDEPNARIRQLNVTANVDTIFQTAEDFSATLSNVDSPRIVTALDPLHEPYDLDTAVQEKANGQIGMGLSFAKAALANTTANIVLVPAAWGGTGFCVNPNIHLPEIAWNTQPQDSDNFGGSLLFDRAVARANLALEESGGILRGILWHQGEADSRVTECTEQYAENLQGLISALRNTIRRDARGSTARGTSSDVPFVAGTLSRGLSLTPNAVAVDTVLRELPSSVAHTGTVIADDLVPPDYPSGEGYPGLHFGAAALRELGQRYYSVMDSLSQP